MNYQKLKDHAARELILILIIAFLVAFIIWRYFDYKIAKIKMGPNTDIGLTIQKNINKNLI